MQSFGPDDLKFTYSGEHTPIGTVEPGERFVVETEDCFTGRFRRPDGFTPENLAWVLENLDGVTGPVAVAGAAELEEYFSDDASAGFAIAAMAERAEQEESFRTLLKRLKVSPRCILGVNGDAAAGGNSTCAFTGASDAAQVVFARAY